MRKLHIANATSYQHLLGQNQFLLFFQCLNMEESWNLHHMRKGREECTWIFPQPFTRHIHKESLKMTSTGVWSYEKHWQKVAKRGRGSFNIITSPKNHKCFCLLYRIFYVLSVKNFTNGFPVKICFGTFWPPKIEGHYVTGNRPILLVFTKKLFIFRQGVGLHYTILQNTFQYFCRIPFSIFAEYLSVVLQKTS